MNNGMSMMNRSKTQAASSAMADDFDALLDDLADGNQGAGSNTNA